MGRSLRSRLFTNHLLVLALGMGVAAALSWWAVETLYLNTQRDNLLAQAELAAAALGGQPLAATAAEPYVQTANVLPGIHTRVLGAQGAVVVGLSATQGAGPVQAPLAENAPEVTAEDLLRRQEIQLALQGQATTAVRRVATAGGRRVLYAAAPIVEADGTVSGLVYLATPLPATGLPPGMMRGLAAAVLVALSLAALAASLLARRIASPVEGVAIAAASVSAGDLDRQVPVERGIRELASLGLAFNQMTKSLRQSNQAKNAFVADVTHELRTPLTVIKGTIETLEDGALNDLAGRGPLLASMQRETERLIRLVNQLLVLVRADAGTLSISLQPVDLSDVARARCQQLSALAAERRVSLLVSVEAGAPACVLGDRDRLAQVMDNLLDNAIRYSPAGSTVAVELRAQRDEWVCSIRDAGPGIPAEHLPLVFERFYRADASRNRQSGGAGLGLAIARALVSAQGGQIRAECPAGGGTIVRFSLPAHANCHGTDNLQTPS
jgi:two-component system sensor histidine kinase BaeS